MSDNRLIPKPLVHKHKEYPEHQWRRTENGEIDDGAIIYGYHNGPMCERCGYSFCVFCDPDGWNKEPCVIDEYHCPNCDHLLSKYDKFCSYCGQAISQEGDKE